jgi:Glu-tRNA(Gln) amidotransferase subunit E-like FAD-binding protein
MDYKKVGFKSGIEVHVQLDVGKLFCRCPSVLRKDKPDRTVNRELHPMAGETGKIDIAALFEQKKKLTYVYEVYNDTTCLVELDEEPPHNINQEALNVAITVAKILNCNILDVTQVMRKTVVDGSNTSGFQRTLLVGKDGYFTLKNGKKVGINYLILEEEAARRTAENKETVTFRLDRLGIPLLEIVTSPDLATPEEVQEAAAIIGSIVASTGKKMRGIGTIRQDINISVKGHPRIEIKGVQDLRHIPKVVDLEIERQLQEIKNKIKTFQHVRNVKDDFTTKFLRPLPGAARMYPETDHALIYITPSILKQIKLPEPLDKRKARFLKMGLSPELASPLLTHPKVEFFDALIKKYSKLNPKLIASTILSLDSEVKKKLNLESYEPPEEDILFIFNELNKGNITKESILDIFLETAKGTPISKVVPKYKLLSDKEVKEEVEKIKKQNKNIPLARLINITMAKLRGKADPKKVIEYLKA